MNSEPAHFQELQKRFTAHIRHPQKHQAPQIEARRMGIYCDLFYRNIENLLRSSFPLLQGLCSDQDWNRLVRAFFHEHRCKTPYFHQIGKEFLQYVEQPKVRLSKLPFLRELVHFEAHKSSLDMAPDVSLDWTGCKNTEELLRGCPVLVQPMEITAYEYPVHKIRPRQLPRELPPAAKPYFVVLYRNLQNQVRHAELNAATARLLVMLQENPQRNGREALEALAQELGRSDVAAVVEYGARTLEELHTLGLIPGVRPVSSHAPVEHS